MIKEKHRDAWKMEEIGGHRMVEKEKEKEMGEDEETDRHRRISREQRELLQSQHTKHQMLFSSWAPQYGTMHR